MTREEANEVLQKQIDENGIEALKVAMAVLERIPCADCISREAALKIFGEVHPMDYNTKAYIAGIKALPSVTQQPRIGKWINLEKTRYKGEILPFWLRYECSECGGTGEGRFNYCPTCGAKMAESEVQDADSN